MIFLDHHADGKVVVRSAGSDPADRLNPAVVAAMAEVGIDLSRELPKPARKKLVSPSRHDPSAWHERLA